jgi:hypothetical protein
MLGITDSRFQDELLLRAKKAGKIPRDYELPLHHRNNSPDRIAETLGDAKKAGHLPAFPFGTDFTAVEQKLIPALEQIKHASGSKRQLATLALSGITKAPAEDENTCLERMGLARPHTLTERIYSLLVKGALRTSPL